MEPENFQVMFRRLEAEVQKVIVGNSDGIAGRRARFG